MSSTKATTPLGIAILGAGIFAIEAHLPAIAALSKSHPQVQVQLKAVYSRSEKSASSLASKASELGLSEPTVYHDPDVDTLLARDDIHAVILVLPIPAQPALIRKALAAGKHILSEKPIAPDVAAGRALIAEYDAQYRSTLVWRVAENFEAEPAHIAAKKLISDGKIGRVVSFSARAVANVERGSKWWSTSWRTVPEYQGGFLLDGGVHTAAILRTILPQRITHLAGFSSLTRDHLAPHDTTHAVLKCADAGGEAGAHGILELSFAGSPSSGVANGISVTGTKGWLGITSGNKIKVAVRLHEQEEEVTEYAQSGVEAELAAFFDAITNVKQGAEGPNTLGDPLGALWDVALVEAVLNSGGGQIDLDALLNGRAC
ncbi:hypothetical protein HWV62_2938 [Athelia sp. TMB]|nr:hypothetical protein HWV62_2938 [Athelia sp. TMB]